MSKGKSKLVRLGGSQAVHIPSALVSDDHYPIPEDTEYVEIEIRRNGLKVSPIKPAKGKGDKR